MQQTGNDVVWPELPPPVGDDDDAMKEWFQRRQDVADDVRMRRGFSESLVQDAMKQIDCCREFAIRVLHENDGKVPARYKSRSTPFRPAPRKDALLDCVEE